MLVRRAAAWLLGGAVALGAPAAWPNGRFPNSGMIVAGPGSRTDVLVLQATFGLVVSHDRGRSWGWICEDAYGTPSGYDPPVAVAHDGALVVAQLDGLQVAADRCGFARPAGDPRLPVLDLAWDASGRSLAAGIGNAGEPNGLLLSDDGGRSWRLGEQIPRLFLDTVEVAPSRPERVYVSGRIGGAPVLYRSDDGGRSLREMTRDFLGGLDAYLAAVDPHDPDLVYVRSNLGAETSLLVSRDGGARFVRVARTENPMTGFALSDDGATVWIASSEPSEGILRSVRGGPFVRTAATVATRCLRYHDGVLYVCGDHGIDGFVVGCSTDGGDHVEALLRLADLRAPLRCPGGTTVGDRCAPLWPMQERFLHAWDAAAAPLGRPHDDAPAEASLDAVADRATDALDDALADAADATPFDATPDLPAQDLSAQDRSARDLSAPTDLRPEASLTAPTSRGPCGCEVPGGRPSRAARALSWALLGAALTRSRRSHSTRAERRERLRPSA